MMPYQTYQLYQIERPKTAFELRGADERAGRTAAALGGMLRRLTGASRKRPHRDHAMGRIPACGRMSTTMEVR